MGQVGSAASLGRFWISGGEEGIRLRLIWPPSTWHPDLRFEIGRENPGDLLKQLFYPLGRSLHIAKRGRDRLRVAVAQPDRPFGVDE